MKILLLNYEYPPLGGGAGICSRYEAEGLANRGNEVIVITTWFEGKKEIEGNGNLKIIRLKSKRKYEYKSNPIEMLSWVKHAKKYLTQDYKSNDFDVCIANFIIPGGIVAKYLKKKWNLPFIIISHGQDIPFFFPKQMLKYHIVTYFWLRNIVNHSQKLILLTKMIKANADKYLGRKNRRKNIIIPNGCDIDTFKPDYSKKSTIFKIIFVGRLVAQKDPFTFLKALEILSTKNIDFKVDILGDGDLRKKMEQFVATKGLSNHVSFLGWVDKKIMLDSYQSANLQVITSHDEAMSIAALESLSTGQYIISTPVSGNTDVIEEGVNGEFIKFNDYKQLANKIENYYHTKFKNKSRVDNEYLNKFRQKYSWDGIVEEYDKILNDIVKNKN